MPAPTFVRGASSGIANATGVNRSLTATLAAPPTPGNLLVAMTGARDAEPPGGLTWPAGWNVAGSGLHGSVVNARWVTVRYRIAQLGDGASLTVSETVSGQWNTPNLFLAEYAGVALLDPAAPAALGYVATKVCALPSLAVAAGVPALVILAVVAQPDVDAEPSVIPAGYVRRLDAHQSGGLNRMRYSLFDNLVSVSAPPYAGSLTWLGVPGSSLFLHRGFVPASSGMFSGEPGGGMW